MNVKFKLGRLTNIYLLTFLILLNVPAWSVPDNNNTPDLYLVGGAIRNMLLGLEANNYDLVCSCSFNELNNYIQNNPELIPLVVDKQKEIIKTTYKKHNVDFKTLHGSEYNDMLERDFTMNSLFAPIAELPKILTKIEDGVKIIDFNNGLDDIKNKIIRCNGDTLTSFKTNPSNIIRAIRFYSVLGFNFDFDIEEFFDSDKVNLIKEIDKDELQKEINKITSTKEANLRYQTLLKNYPILERALETYS